MIINSQLRTLLLTCGTWSHTWAISMEGSVACVAVRSFKWMSMFVNDLAAIAELCIDSPSCRFFFVVGQWALKRFLLASLLKVIITGIW